MDGTTNEHRWARVIYEVRLPFIFLMKAVPIMTERVLVQASRWTKKLFSSWILHCLRLQAAGFPTLLFFPSWNKSFDPVSGFWTTCLFIGCLLIWEVSPCLGYSFHLLLLLHMHLRNLHWQITVGSDRTVAAFAVSSRDMPLCPIQASETAFGSKTREDWSQGNWRGHSYWYERWTMSKFSRMWDASLSLVKEGQ